MSRRVVVTGIGAVTSIGIGREEFFENLLQEKNCIERIPDSFEKSYSFKSKHYIPFCLPPLSDYAISASYEMFFQGVHKLGVITAKLAFEDAGFTLIPNGKTFRVEGASKCSVSIGVGFIGIEEAFHSYLVHSLEGFGEKYAALLDGKRYNRMIIPVMMPDSIAAWVSILFRLKGSSTTLNASCASGTYAIGDSFRRIRDGYETLMLTGGVEYLKEDSGSVMRGFDALGALTKSEDGRPLPFSERRSGFLFSEGGGCLLVLEELDHALSRGATIYAEIADYRSNSDAFNILQIDSSGEQIRKLLGDLKGRNSIDYINTHGTGTPMNDEIEARIIKDIFGNKKSQPYINATKGIIGHTIGASGAIEAAVVVSSIKEAKIHGNTVPDPIEDLRLATRSMSLPIKNAISTSYGFGGHNAGLLFRRYE